MNLQEQISKIKSIMGVIKIYHLKIRSIIKLMIVKFTVKGFLPMKN
jgi:hypothetical protein